MSEQYRLHWRQVDFERRQLYLLKTENGDPRVIPLNAEALAALGQLPCRDARPGISRVFPSAHRGLRAGLARVVFDRAR
jgi:integrase